MQFETFIFSEISSGVKRKLKSCSVDKTKMKNRKPLNYEVPIIRIKNSSLKKKKEALSENVGSKTQNLICSRNFKEFKKEINLAIPWISKFTIKSEKSLKFHYEIFDFLNYISPSQLENNLKLRSFYILQNLINLRWPTWKIKIYGSFIINLHLKNSDIDITVIKSQNLNFSNNEFSDYDDISDFEMLSLIYEFILENKFSIKENTHLIPAKVPIIKCVCNETGVKIDIRYLFVLI